MGSRGIGREFSVLCFCIWFVAAALLHARFLCSGLMVQEYSVLFSTRTVLSGGHSSPMSKACETTRVPTFSCRHSCGRSRG